MKIIVAPDKFKGSLTSFEVCKNIEAGIRQMDEKADVHCFPMADGGDGFARVLKYYLPTETIECKTVDPLQRPITASYEWDEIQKTAIIELAVASGLAILKTAERNPLLTSTYGTGLLIKDAIVKGAEKIILGLGGSATNDAGTGILAALGFTFLDADEKPLQPNGAMLTQIQEIIVPTELSEIEFEIACDVKNPLFGNNGAAFVYAPQKGAGKDEVQLLDEGLINFNNILIKNTGKNFAQTPGAGAAGGIAVGLISFFNVVLTYGIELVIAASGIENFLKNADIVITGEGKIDSQTSEGKVVGSIAKLAGKYNIPVIGFCGNLQLHAREISELGLAYASAICAGPSPLEDCIANAASLIKEKSSACYLFYSHFLR